MKLFAVIIAAIGVGACVTTSGSDQTNDANVIITSNLTVRGVASVSNLAVVVGGRSALNVGGGAASFGVPVVLASTNAGVVSPFDAIVGALLSADSQNGSLHNWSGALAFQYWVVPNGPMCTNYLYAYLGASGVASLYREDTNGYYRIWDAGNQGAGSSMDADLLDGHHAAEFAVLQGGNIAVAEITNALAGMGLRGGAGQHSLAEGISTEASGNYSHAEGEITFALARGSHTEGNGTYVYGDYGHAEGIASYANAYSSHSEGGITRANGAFTHSEGFVATANGWASHAEGNYTHANGDISHAEGDGTTAGGYASHTEGWDSSAGGEASHAEGLETQADGRYAHAAGQKAKALHDNTFVWSDGTSTESTSTQQFTVCASSGIRLLGGATEADRLVVHGTASFEGGISYLPPQGNLSMGCFTNRP